MAITKNNQNKLKIFIKTYLCVKKEATCRELTDCCNSFNFSIHNGVTNNEMAKFLRKLMCQTNQHFLDGLTFRKNSHGTKIYYLKWR